MSDSKMDRTFQPKPPPTDPAEIHFKRAWQHRKNKQYAQAADEFQESLKHSPDKGATHFNLGWVYDQLGKGRQAIDHVRQAVDCFQKKGSASNIDTAQNLLNKLLKKYPPLTPEA